MSGQTPVAISGWSITRITSVLTPCFSMMSVLSLINFSVWLGSGDFVSVALKTSAFSPVKSQVLSSLLCTMLPPNRLNIHLLCLQKLNQDLKSPVMYFHAVYAAGENSFYVRHFRLPSGSDDPNAVQELASTRPA